MLADYTKQKCVFFSCINERSLSSTICSRKLCSLGKTATIPAFPIPFFTSEIPIWNTKNLGRRIGSWCASNVNLSHYPVSSLSTAPSSYLVLALRDSPGAMHSESLWTTRFERHSTDSPWKVCPWISITWHLPFSQLLQFRPFGKTSWFFSFQNVIFLTLTAIAQFPSHLLLKLLPLTNWPCFSCARAGWFWAHRSACDLLAFFSHFQSANLKVNQKHLVSLGLSKAFDWIWHVRILAVSRFTDLNPP